MDGVWKKMMKIYSELSYWASYVVCWFRNYKYKLPKIDK